MKKLIYISFIISISSAYAQKLTPDDLQVEAAWAAVGDKIKTIWTSKITPQNVWQDYPRPQMVRKDWKNLNGLWEYAILHRMPRKMVAPIKYKEKILVSHYRASKKDNSKIKGYKKYEFSCFY